FLLPSSLVGPAQSLLMRLAPPPRKTPSPSAPLVPLTVFFQRVRVRQHLPEKPVMEVSLLAQALTWPPGACQHLGPVPDVADPHRQSLYRKFVRPSPTTALMRSLGRPRLTR